jgi:hypothetical protein
MGLRAEPRALEPLHFDSVAEPISPDPGQRECRAGTLHEPTVCTN